MLTHVRVLGVLNMLMGLLGLSKNIRVRETKEAVSDLIPSPRLHKGLLYACEYILDSGSIVSVVPPSTHERQHPDTNKCFFHAANGSIIKHLGQEWIRLLSWDEGAHTG